MQTNNHFVEKVHSFWFGNIDKMGQINDAVQKRWWQKDPVFDELIRYEFEADLKLATIGSYNHLLTTAKGRLILIILLDQFSRNIYRNKAQAFAQDPLALKWSMEGIENKLDQSLLPIERVFFYMPLEHAEDKEIQQQSVKLFKSLCNDAPKSQLVLFQNFLQFAKAHQTIIERFGRFPHRNAILHRNSTPEEITFLQQPNSAF